MSLLMDALKKAELAKRQGPAAGGAADPPAQGGLELEPISSGSDSAAAKPAVASAADAGDRSRSPSHLEELDAQFLAEAEQTVSARLKAPAHIAEPVADRPATPGTAQRTTSPDGAQERSSAQNLFAAKQVDQPPPRKTFALAIGAVTVLSVCAIGGYFWWQLQPKSAVIASRAPPPLAPVAASTPAQTGPTAVPASAAPASVPVLAAPSMPASQQSAAGRVARAAEDKVDEPVAVVARTGRQSRRAVSAPSAPAEAESPIHVTKAPLKVNPSLIRGFDAFNRGDLAVAKLEYERAQKSDPHNTDALHGLAAIAVREGRAERAELLYRQITEADPQDTIALSALINSRAQIDPVAAESRLKSLSAAQPELAAPQFSLGNLYARHGRWNDAQQAYFRAYSAESDNPDILYNLAISLEHLRQNTLAAQYYALAIAAAQTRPAGFDKAQAAARLQSLQR